MKTLAFGETLWDLIGHDSFLGGAAFNVAAHLAKLGAESHLVSAVGDDRLGDAALSTAESFGMECDFIGRAPGVETGTVNVHLSADGQPSYVIREDVAWDRIELSIDKLQEVVNGSWDFMVFGTLAQRSEVNRATLDDLVDALPEAAKIVYDINLRQNFHRPEWIRRSMDRCSILKINDEEARYLSKAIVGRELPLRDIAELLAQRHSIETLLITRGGEGADLLSVDGWEHVDSERIEVVDAVGAGDAFTAGLIFALGHGKRPREAAAFASKLGGFVASSRGAVPEYSDAIKGAAAKIAEGSSAGA